MPAESPHITPVIRGVTRRNFPVRSQLRRRGHADFDISWRTTLLAKVVDPQLSAAESRVLAVVLTLRIATWD
jgi:hypothetical protein